MSDQIRLSRPLAGDDTILPFRLDRSNLRGRVARVDRTLDRILAQHRYPDPVSALVADAVMLTALIGQAVKLRWKFSLQIRGDGPVRLIATDYFAPEQAGQPARMRAYAAFDMGEVVSSRTEPFEMLGAGVFGVTIDQGPDMRPYQGVTPLAGGTLAACAETYFAQSEQIATRFHALAALSEMPGHPPHWRYNGRFAPFRCGLLVLHPDSHAPRQCQSRSCRLPQNPPSRQSWTSSAPRCPATSLPRPDRK